jgi:hypothetical protein
LGFKFFKEFIPVEIDKRTYKFTKIENKETRNALKLKLRLLNHLVENKIPIKQIQTKDDNSFRIDSGSVSIEIVEIDKIYIVRRNEDKMTPNIRFLFTPGSVK